MHSNVFFVSGKDTLWLLEIYLTSIRPNEQLLLARLIDRVIGNGEILPDVLSAVQAVCEVHPLLAAVMEPRFKAIELGTPEATRMKESWEEMMKWQQHREAREKESPLLKPPPAERIAYLIDKFERGDLDSWWRLNLEMTLEPRSIYVCLRERGYCWRIQSQSRKLFIFSLVKRISPLFEGVANSIRKPKAHILVAAQLPKVRALPHANPNKSKK